MDEESHEQLIDRVIECSLIHNHRSGRGLTRNTTASSRLNRLKRAPARQLSDYMDCLVCRVRQRLPFHVLPELSQV